MGVTILVDVDDGRDLVPVTLWECQSKSILEMVEEINDHVQKAKQKKF